MPRAEAEIRDELTKRVERAYLVMTDQGAPGEEWPPGALDDLAGAVACGAELKIDHGDDALLRAIGDLEALGDMRAELYAAAIGHIAHGDNDA